MKPTLVIMVKVPWPGRVKTRLARDVGPVAAAWWFRHQVGRLLRRVEDRRWRTVLAVAPDAAGLRSRVWPAHLQRWPQGTGDLGDRMVRVMARAGGPVCVIGADIPGITRSKIAHAFACLGAADAVFGPSPDGGFWLVGLKRPSPPPVGLFAAVRWSSEHALDDSIASLGRARIALADVLADVDTADDLTMTS